MPDTCSKCSSSLDADALFCSSCAAPVNLPCPSCGKSIRANAKFCKYCAFRLTEQTHVARVETPPVPASPETPASKPQSAIPERTQQYLPDAGPKHESLDVPATTATNRPSGIGGWLIFPAIGMVISPILIVGGLLHNITILSESIGALELDYPGAHKAMLAQSIFGFAFLCFHLYVAALFFTKRRNLPKMISSLLLVNLMLTIITGALYANVFRDPIDAKEMWKAFVLAAVWIPYFHLSKRVKATFIT
jgi:hypothetical protein